MKPKHKIQELCADFYEDDGIPMRQRHRTKEMPDQRKIRQLRHHIEQWVALLISEDPRYTSIHLLEVEPVEQQNAFWVTLGYASTLTVTQKKELEHHLHQDKKRWREQIAHSLKRKRVPDLRLNLLPQQEVKS